MSKREPLQSLPARARAFCQRHQLHGGIYDALLIELEAVMSEAPRRMGEKGGRRLVELYGSTPAEGQLQLGGMSKAKRPSAHFVELGKRGGAKVRELIAAGRAAAKEEG